MIIRYGKTNSEFEITKNDICFLSIENPRLFEDFYCCSINKETENALTLVDGTELLDFRRNVSVINGPDDLVLDTNSVRKKLYSELSMTMQDDDINQQISSLLREAIILIENVAIQSGYDIDVEAFPEAKDLLSLFRVTPKEEGGFFAQRFIEYAKTINALLGISIYLILNCDGFIDGHDYELIRKEAAYKGFTVLFVNPRQVGYQNGVREYIIDYDFCEI